MSEPVLSLRGIRRDFPMGNQWVRVLKGIDLDVQPGEYIALMGPSGSGKSTLMNLLGCLDTPTSGSYFLAGEDVSRMDDDALAEVRNKKIGFVFQTFNLLPRQTALQNVALPLVYAGWSKADRQARATEVLGMVGLGDRMDHQPNQLSGGQRQRVAVARALAVEPEVLLMDEPLSNLDALLRLEMRAELKRLLKETRTTTLYVTHDQVEAMSLADRIAVMRQGEIVQLGTPTEIYHAPADTFVGGFIGNPPMNFLRAGALGGRVVLEGFAVPSPVEGEVLLGVRPEDLRVSKEQAEGAFRARVLVVEPLGPHLQLTLEREGETFRALADPDFSVAFGEEVWVRPNPGRVRLFHPKTGKALA